MDWSTTENTSVWDSISVTGAITVANSQAGGLRIHPGARLKIAPGGQLTATGATDINEPKGLWIVSNASGTGSFIDNGTINYLTGGTALVQRYLDPDKWHGYCIPLTQTITQPYKDYYMKYYDNPGHHFRYVINPALDSLLNSDGLGYMMWSKSTTTGTTPVSPAGSLNTGSVTIPVVRSAYPGASGQDYDNWNMVGNPYVSAVDLASAGITWNNVIKEAYFWDPTGGNYIVYIYAGGGTHSQYAAAQQGFFVRHDTTTTASTSLVYTGNTVRVHNSSAFLKEELADMLLIKVVNSANTYSDLGVVRFAEGTTPGLDENIDALKLDGNVDAPKILFPVPGDFNLHVDVLPWYSNTTTIPMSFTLLPEATNVITVEGIESFKPGTQILLEDKKENKIQDMVANASYQFTSNPQDDPARFLWHFTKSTIGIDDPGLAAMQIFSFDHYIYVKNLVTGTTRGVIFVYDLTGRTVFTADLKDMQLNKFEPGVVAGYYLARVITNDRTYTQKVYLK